MATNDSIRRAMLPIPDRSPIGLTGPFGLSLAIVVACGCNQPTAPTGLGVDSPGRPDNSITSKALSEVATPPGENGAAPAGEFQLTKIDNSPSPGAPPEGMAWIPGGEFSMGANESPDRDDVGMKATLDARPIHRVYVDGFYMDKADVTNRQFAR